MFASLAWAANILTREQRRGVAVNASDSGAHMKVDAESGLSRTAREVLGSIPTKGATLFSVLFDMIVICQAK